MIPGGTIALLLATLAALPWAEADTVDVQGRGAVDLAPYACTDITRSSLIDRVCYDRSTRQAIIQVLTTYRQFCNVPQATYKALLDAPSMGRFYRARIERSADAARYDCFSRAFENSTNGTVGWARTTDLLFHRQAL